MASLPGKVGTVVASSPGALNEGAVKVFGSTWTAYPVDGEEPLEAGDRVQVGRVQGASIYVRRVDHEMGWRGEECAVYRRGEGACCGDVGGEAPLLCVLHAPSCI